MVAEGAAAAHEGMERCGVWGVSGMGRMEEGVKVMQAGNCRGRER